MWEARPYRFPWNVRRKNHVFVQRKNVESKAVQIFVECEKKKKNNVFTQRVDRVNVSLALGVMDFQEPGKWDKLIPLTGGFASVVASCVSILRGFRPTSLCYRKGPSLEVLFKGNARCIQTSIVYCMVSCLTSATQVSLAKSRALTNDKWEVNGVGSEHVSCYCPKL